MRKRAIGGMVGGFLLAVLAGGGLSAGSSLAEGTVERGRDGAQMGTGGEVGKPAPSANGGRMVRAELDGLFRRYCARCHDRDGSGGRTRDSLPSIPDFTSHPWHQRRSNTQLEASILEGKGSAMLAFAGRVSGEEALGLVAVIRSFDPRPWERADPPEGFDQRWRALEAEWRELREQFRKLEGQRGR